MGCPAGMAIWLHWSFDWALSWLYLVCGAKDFLAATPPSLMMVFGLRWSAGACLMLHLLRSLVLVW